MAKGIVKKYDKVKGYGFIVNRDVAKKDIFFHYSQVEQKGDFRIREGEQVEFELEQNSRGPRAKHVRQPGSR